MVEAAPRACADLHPAGNQAGAGATGVSDRAAGAVRSGGDGCIGCRTALGVSTRRVPQPRSGPGQRSHAQRRSACAWLAVVERGTRQGGVPARPTRGRCQLPARASVAARTRVLHQCRAWPRRCRVHRTQRWSRRDDHPIGESRLPGAHAYRRRPEGSAATRHHPPRPHAGQRRAVAQHRLPAHEPAGNGYVVRFDDDAVARCNPQLAQAHCKSADLAH